MRKKNLFLLILFLLTAFKAHSDASLKEALELYNQGKYIAVTEKLETQLLSEDPKINRGLIHYWLGISYSRSQNYPLAIKNFKLALDLKFEAKDLDYELAQALFASEQLVDAKIYFNESFKKDFKIGTCLYYMAYISKELGQLKNAESLYDVISKLPPEESKEVLQAAKFQLVDIKLEKVEKKSKVIQQIESFIIPEYEKVIAINPQSYLVPKIKEKIIQLQKKYQLVLFQLRNGLPTTFPRYFLRVAEEMGYDTNVVYAPTETNLTTTELASLFSKTEAFGRYTFYAKDFISISPELRINYSRYFNRDENILKNDNMMIAPVIRTTFEHTLFNRPASTLFDYEFNQVERDINAEKTLNFASRAHTLGIGERFNFFKQGASTLRLKLRMFESYLEDSNSKNWGLVFEQTLTLTKGMLLLFTSYDRTRVNTEAFDSDALTIRGDYLFPSYHNWNPSLGFAVTLTDPINNRSARGLEKLINPSLRLNRKIGKNWGANIRYEFYENISKDKENFGYRKNLFGLEMEYLF